jgi:chromosomal replication initiation ATPase DnaA
MGKGNLGLRHIHATRLVFSIRGFFSVSLRNCRPCANLSSPAANSTARFSIIKVLDAFTYLPFRVQSGVGKTWLGCAMAQAACRDGVTVFYKRMPRLFEELELAHGDGRFPRLFRSVTKAQLLILDDCQTISFTQDRFHPSQQ